MPVRLLADDDIDDPGRLVYITGWGDRTAIVRVSTRDFTKVKRYEWRVHATRGHIVRRYTKAGRAHLQTLPRFLLGQYSGRLTFRNGNVRDMRRENMLVVQGCVQKAKGNLKRPWRPEIWIDGRAYYCGFWPARWLAEQALAKAIEIKPELEGRGYSPSRVRFRLHRAVGVLVFSTDAQLSEEA